MNGEYVKKSDIGELVFKMKPQKLDYYDPDNYYAALQFYEELVEKLEFAHKIMVPEEEMEDPYCEY